MSHVSPGRGFPVTSALFWRHSFVRATQHDFLKLSDAVFSKELPIAKPAKYT